MEWVEKNVRSDLLETVALTKRQEAEMEVAELKMLRFALRVTRMDKIRNEYIRGTAQVGRFGEKTREARLTWYGHIRRKYDGYNGRRMLLEDGVVRNRKQGKPKMRFLVRVLPTYLPACLHNRHRPFFPHVHATSVRHLLITSPTASTPRRLLNLVQFTFHSGKHHTST